MPRPTSVDRNVLSFDLEHWHTATLIRSAISDPTDRIENSVDRVLDLLDRLDVTATFFVVGEVADEYPDLIARVADRGHELGTHGHTHTPLFDLDPESFAAELDRSVAAIERAAAVDVRGFRAPNFSITRDTAWALEVLAERGFDYDTSVFPIKTPMYGVRGAPHQPYHVNSSAPFASVAGTGRLLELPMAVHPRFKVPVAGGFYARLLPTRILEWGIDALNERGYPATLYFHPWEFNPDVRSDEPPAHARFVSYHGIERTGAVLERLLETYSFGSVAETLADESCTDEHL